MYINDDPIMRLIRRSLNQSPKTIAALASELRLDAGVNESVGTVADSLAIAQTCVLELGCRPLIETGAHHAALKSQLAAGRPDTFPVGFEVSLNEIPWSSPYYINLTTASGEEVIGLR